LRLAADRNVHLAPSALKCYQSKTDWTDYE
jgi:hypothetical protein